MPRNVPLIRPDLPTLEEIEAPLRSMLASGKLTNFGVHNQALERGAEAYLGAQVATVSSGSQALLFALQALGVGAPPGAPPPRVLIPSFTFMATAQAVVYAGAVPSYLEVGDDGNVDVEDLRAQLARLPDAAAVIGVHVYGLPCDVDGIEAVVADDAKRRGRRVKVLYDAAHAFGSALADGRRVGSLGDAEAFSLSVTKALVCVEGGMVTSRDPALIERVRRMRNYGIQAAYDAAYPGVNGKMSELHALIGVANLARLDERLARRRELAATLTARLHERTGFRTIPVPPGVTHTFKDFVVRVPTRLASRRDAVCAALKERGIETRAYFFPPVHEQVRFKAFADRPLPRTERFSREVITLPFFTTLQPEDMDAIVDGLAAAERALA